MSAHSYVELPSSLRIPKAGKIQVDRGAISQILPEADMRPASLAVVVSFAAFSAFALAQTTEAQTGSSVAAQKVMWQGNGTNPDGTCGNLNEGLTGVPSGQQGWLFILTAPAPGPWTLTAEFKSTAPNSITAAGMQEGDGSVHFIVDTAVGDSLQSASATNGTANSVLTVSGCTANTAAAAPGTTSGGTPPTSPPTSPGNSTTPTGPGTSPGSSGTGGPSSGTAPSSSGTTGPSSGVTAAPAAPAPATAFEAAPAAAGTGTDKPITGATSIQTGEPWAGSRLYEVAVATAGILTMVAGLVVRRRRRLLAQ